MLSRVKNTNDTNDGIFSLWIFREYLGLPLTRRYGTVTVTIHYQTGTLSWGSGRAVWENDGGNLEDVEEVLHWTFSGCMIL